MEQIEFSILKGLLYDEEYCRKVIPHLKEEYFEGPTKTIFKLYSKFFNEYNKIPNTEALAISLQKEKLDEHTYNDCVDTITNCISTRKMVSDTEWLVAETEDYCKTRSLYDSIYKAIDIISGTDKKMSSGAIPDLLQKSLSISFDTTIGSDYIEDALKRYEWYTSAETKLKFRLAALNALSNDGLPPKTLNVILAGCVHPKTKIVVRKKLL